jgi:competence protein ComFB
MVLDELERQLGLEENDWICKCEECVLDMAALALNSVKPLYRVSLMGTLYAHSLQDSEYGEEIRKSVAVAIGKVGKNPAHD